jgi:hypothetical protein
MRRALLICCLLVGISGCITTPDWKAYAYPSIDVRDHAGDTPLEEHYLMVHLELDY